MGQPTPELPAPAAGAEGLGGAYPVLPPREFTRIGFMVDDGDSGGGAAEEIGGALTDFSVRVLYADASGRPRGELQLKVANGQYPRVTDRGWEHLSIE